MKSDLVDIAGVKHAETDKAILSLAEAAGKLVIRLEDC